MSTTALQRDVMTLEEPGAAPVVAQSETAAIVSMIERAARDPNVDIDKMERLLGMQERTLALRSKGAYIAALAAMQPELPVIRERGGIKDKNGKVQSTYALWEDLNEQIKPVLAKHGFALSFRTGHDPEGRILVTGVLSHREGHGEETTMRLPVDSSGSKNAVQAVGSSTSYGKRYTAMALLNLTSRGEDDDGAHGGGSPEAITDDQATELRELADAVGADVRRFCQHMKVDGIAALPAARFNEAVKALEAKRNAGGRR